jgi:hypothetical protein
MKKTLLIILIAIGLISCKKSFLEVTPLGSQLAVTTSDYDKIMNDPALYFSFSKGGLTEAQLMGDEVDAQANLFNGIDPTSQREQFFAWSDIIYPHVTAFPGMLSLELSQRYAINKVIREVMSSTDGTQQEKSRIRAEALATRAWSNFQLVNYYCKPYMVTTAGTDPGFPLITEPDVNTVSFSRGTLQETYDAIIRDFTDAINGLPENPISKTRMSKPAAQGLLGKVYLFMGRPNDAIPLFKSALASVSASGMSSLYNYNITLADGGSFLPVSSGIGPLGGPGNNNSDMKEAVVSKVFYSGRYNNNVTGNNGLILTASAAGLYSPNDKRLLLYTDANTDDTPITVGGKLRKYGVQYSRWGLQLPELLLLSAECKARLNDLAGAKKDVETLRQNRMPAAEAAVTEATANNKEALIRFIIDERTREFAMEGYRWADMRRLSVDPVFKGIVFSHKIFDDAGSPTTYILNQPNRLVLKLPDYFVDSNPGMVNNP